MHPTTFWFDQVSNATAACSVARPLLWPRTTSCGPTADRRRAARRPASSSSRWRCLCCTRAAAPLARVTVSLTSCFPTQRSYSVRYHDLLRAERRATMYLHCRLLFLPIGVQLQHRMTSDFLCRRHCSLSSIATRQSFRDWLNDANATLLQSPHVLGRDFLPVNSISLESPEWRGHLASTLMACGCLTWYHM